jgi:UDP-N-acetylmuramate dehydrogenase
VIAPALRSELERLLGADVAFDAPMSRCTSMRVGGPADALVRAPDREKLAATLALATREGVPVTIVGEGFNTVVTDEGLDGIVLKLAGLRRLELDESGDAPVLLAEAGVRHASVTRLCIETGLSGLEFAAGIPGSVGGWLAMNAGIGVREMMHVTLAIEWMSADGAATVWSDAEELDFGYRSLRGLPDGAVLVAGRFAVTKAEPGAVKQAVDEHMAHRARTQPVTSPSCGSVFRNPEGDFAGRLIEAAGLKGLRVGGAEVSTIHANFIVTEPGTRARDVLELIERVQARVEADSGVWLHKEVKVIGRGAS